MNIFKEEKMKITWMGQAGLLFEVGEKKIIIDPYLSNSVAKIQPQNFRRQPVDERFLKIRPDIIVLTHNHADHTDKETLKHYLGEDTSVVVLASYNAWKEVRQFGGVNNNYVMFNCGTVWTEGDITFEAIPAEHSDDFAIGVILNIDKKHYYITGDTLYNHKIFESLPNDIEAVFLPINGKGNNMNFSDAKRFVERINAKYCIPMHIGMFDDIKAEEWQVENKRIPKLYQSIKF